jgi:transcriptional regulator with XRE-family HTH domain
MPDIPENRDGIGRRIARVRKARGLTQLELSARVPCSKSLIAQVEGGHKPATPSLTAAVARVLGVGIGQLTGQPYDDPEYGRVHSTVPHIQRALLSWDLPDEDLPVRSIEALAADVARASDLGRRARYTKLGELLPSLLDELTTACHAADGAEQTRLYGMLAEAYTGVTAIAYALGKFDLRTLGMDRVQWATERSRDPLRAMRSQWQRSTLYLQAAAYDRGLRLLDRIRHDLGDDLTSMDPPMLSMYGAAHLRSAMFAARAADRSTAWEHIAAARETADRLGRHAAANHYGMEFSPTNCDLHALGVAVETYDGARVAELADIVRLPTGTAPVRAGRWYMDLAKGWLDAGRRDKSAEALAQARRVSPEQTRAHPQARETVRVLIEQERQSKESLVGLAHWMGIT